MNDPHPSELATPPAEPTGAYLPGADTQPAPEGLPARVGRYRVEGEVARGGMGVVLRAADEELGRTLAVKLLLPEHRGRPELEGRFLEEARLTGQLQHPGVPPVHELGRMEDSAPFFAMKLVKGRTLADLLAERRSPAEDLPRSLNIFQQVCQAVAYAHGRGVVHRDLKPANVMVGAFGEVQVMDWGLAKALGGEASRGRTPPEGQSTVYTRAGGEPTQAGSVMGTPGYMAPEQARGEVSRIDERSDVFGLGAILCVVLTGQPSFRGDDAQRQARQGDLADAFARLDGCDADPELAALAKRCLAAEPSERPRHAGEVADAVAAHQAAAQERLQQAERARAAAVVRAAEERKRRRLAVGLGATLLCLVGGAGAVGLWYQDSQARQKAEQAARQAEEREERAARLAALDRGAEAALAEAEAARRRALEQAGDLKRWGAALALAGAALARAEALLDQEQDTDEGLRGRARGLRGALADDERDQTLAEAVEKIRGEMAELDATRTRLRRPEGYPKLKAALRRWGLAVGEGDPDEAAARVRGRPGPARQGVVAALDLCLALAPKEEAQARDWLRKVLPAIDPDPWRRRARAAMAARDQTALRRLADEPEAARQGAAFVVALAEALPWVAEEKARLLRRARARHPSDFWVHVALAWVSREAVLSGPSPPPGRPLSAAEAAGLEEAVRWFSVARALRPGDPFVHNGLALALYVKGDLDGAVASLREAIRLDPKFATAHYGLGAALEAQGDLAGAVASFREAARLDPKDAAAHGSLGRALTATGDFRGAVASLREAVRLDPQDANAHYGLGVASFRQRDFKGAVASLREAVRLKPKAANAHFSLGAALRAQGDLAGAVASLREATRLDPKSVAAHSNLASALRAQGDLAGVVVSLREVTRLDPKNARAHCDLGLALRGQGELAGAVASYREAVRLDPKFAEAHSNLGAALLEWGHFTEARAALTRARGLLPLHPLRPSVESLFKGCDRMLALEKKLPAVLAGEAKPANAREGVELAWLCARPSKRLNAAAARLYAEAFAAEPRLADSLRSSARYDAACAAALAAAGRGEDAAGLTAAGRARLRHQAQAWLRADLATWGGSLKKGGAKAASQVQKTVAHWHKDAELASVRDGEALAALPEGEAEGWRKLWADAADLLLAARAAARGK